MGYTDLIKVYPDAAETRKALEIKEYDKKCRECEALPDDEMLCEGIRPDWAVGTSQPLYRYLPCEKFIRQEQRTSYIRKLRESGIPQQFWDAEDETLNITSTTIEYGGETIPKLWFSHHEDAGLDWLLRLGVTVCKNYGSFKFIHFPIFLDKYTDWRSLLSDYAEKFDVLVIHRYDMGKMPEFIADYMFELIQQRLLHNRPTIVTGDLSKEPRNDSDRKVLDILETWQKD